MTWGSTMTEEPSICFYGPPIVFHINPNSMGPYYKNSAMVIVFSRYYNTHKEMVIYDVISIQLSNFHILRQGLPPQDDAPEL